MSNDTSSITMRLEAYLIQLSMASRRWTDWLRNQEHAAIGLDVERLNQLSEDAGQLVGELNEIKASRSRMLEDAAQLGLPSGNLQALARSLPAWKKSSLRNAVSAARSNLESLRKIHIAAWVLIHQLAQFYSESLRLLTEGSTGRPAYVTTGATDTGGGNLLDQDL